LVPSNRGRNYYEERGRVYNPNPRAISSLKKPKKEKQEMTKEELEEMFGNSIHNYVTDEFFAKVEKLPSITIESIREVVDTLPWIRIVLLPTYLGLDLGQPRKSEVWNLGIKKEVMENLKFNRASLGRTAMEWVLASPNIREKLAEAISTRIEERKNS
jgi:hypothetical protein